MMTVTGGCLCGDIRYAIRGPAVLAAYCHCRDCQRTSGNGHCTAAMFAEDSLAVTSGKVMAYSCLGASGGGVVREFCGRCGSRLFGRAGRMKGMVTVALGSLDDPNAFAPDIHIFAKDRPAWDHVHPQDTVFEGYPEE